MSIRNFFLKKVLALSFLLLVLLECILGASVLLFRDHLLRNAQSMGMLLTESHAREIETQLNEYSTLLQMAKVNIQKMQQEQADLQSIQQWITQYNQDLEQMLKNRSVDLQAVLGDQIVSQDGIQQDFSRDYTSATWYQQAVEAQGQPVYIDPLNGTAPSQAIFTVSCLLENGVDALVLDVKLSNTRTAEIAATAPERFDFYLFDSMGNLVYSVLSYTDADPESTLAYHTKLLDGARDSSLFAYNSTIRDLQGLNRGVYYAHMSNGWIIMMTIPLEDILLSRDNTVVVNILMLLIGLIFMGIIVFGVRDLYIQHKANTDGLTGLLNKSAFLTQVKKHLRHANGTLVIIDLDNFKKVNDLYGHDQGDAVLRQTASLLSSTFRSTDLVGRFGGDEFMVLIPKHLDEQVLNRKFSHLCDSLNQISLQYPQANLSMSIGAGYCLKGADYETVFKQVDETLYQVKRSGKNSFQIHRPEHGAAHSKG